MRISTRRTTALHFTLFLSACGTLGTEPEKASPELTGQGVAPAYSQSASTARPFGSVLGDFNGVTIYSNGSTSTNSGQYNSVSGYTTGIKWQCVEYIVRYYKVRYGKQIRGGNAKDFFVNAASKGLDHFPNAGAMSPRVGDILVSEGGSWGHVGIVREVGKDYVLVANQNFTNSSADATTRLTMTVKEFRPQVGPPSYSFTVGGFSKSLPIRGWLRVKG